MMRWEVSEDPVVQRAFDMLDRDEIVQMTDEESTMLMLAITQSLRNAILRLADEIDALKLAA
jgi:hypothetical protein